MRKLVLFIAILLLVGCMKKEVKFGDEDLELKGTKLYYKDKLFTCLLYTSL